MRGGPSFADVLDEALGTGVVQGFRPASRFDEFRRANGAPAIGPLPPFLFFDFKVPFRATPYAGRSPSPPKPPRPKRLLTLRQQRALDALTGLGANLRADFTMGELRTAFRALALRYHPDRHPASGEADTARLSRLFAEASDSYRCLLAALEPSQPTRH